MEEEWINDYSIINYIISVLILRNFHGTFILLVMVVVGATAAFMANSNEESSNGDNSTISRANESQRGTGSVAKKGTTSSLFHSESTHTTRIYLFFGDYKIVSFQILLFNTIVEGMIAVQGNH